MPLIDNERIRELLLQARDRYGIPPSYVILAQRNSASGSSEIIFESWSGNPHAFSEQQRADAVAASRGLVGSSARDGREKELPLRPGSPQSGVCLVDGTTLLACVTFGIHPADIDAAMRYVLGSTTLELFLEDMTPILGPHPE